MDSEKRDQTQGRRREEALARRMGLALDQLAHHDTGECPNAELIAAAGESLWDGAARNASSYILPALRQSASFSGPGGAALACSKTLFASSNAAFCRTMSVKM